MLHFRKADNGYNVSVYIVLSLLRLLMLVLNAAFLGFVEKMDQYPSLKCLADLENVDRFVPYLKVKCTSVQHNKLLHRV